MIKKIEIILLGLILTSTIYSQTITNQLEEAYNLNSKSKLNKFFRNWHDAYKPVDYLDLSDTAKAIYDIYTKFYIPNKLSKIGYSEWGHKTYWGTKYVIIQNKIDYEFIETLNFDTIKLNSFLNFYPSGLTYKMVVDSSLNIKYLLTESLMEKLHHFGKNSIIDFRPDIKLIGKKTLYLIGDYYKTVNQFLKNEFDSLGTGGIMNPAQSKGVSKNRQGFLKRHIKVIPGHWGGYWHIETLPEVNYILLDTDLKRAKVYFRLVNEGGEADFEKTDSGWKMIKSELTWIE